MASRAPDPFAPPDAPSAGEDGALEIEARAPSKPAALPTLAEPGALPVPQPRKPVKYKRPDGGFHTFVIWGFAFVGLGALVLGGARMVRSKVEARPAVAAKPAEPPPKPVTWKSVASGDKVLVTIEIAPRGRKARLLIDGEPLPSNPVSLPRGGRHTITAVADGFEPTAVEVVADASKSVRVELERSR